MGVDLLVLAIFLLLAEKYMLREKYVLFSPYFILNISLLYIYVLPIIFTAYPDSQNYLSRLPDNLVEPLLVKVRIFYYLFAVVSLFSFTKIRKAASVETVTATEQTVPQLTQTFMLISWAALLAISVFVDLAKVGFSVTQFIQMQINPRAFTFLRSGLGPLTYVVNVAKMLLLFISAVYFIQRKSLDSVFFLIMAGLVNMAGGSKSSLLIIFIFVLIVNQKIRKKRKKVSLLKAVLLSVLFVCAALLSFYFMRGETEIRSFADLIDFIVSYAQEAFFSACVINDFQWEWNNIWIAVRSFLLTPIPRAIFAGKGFYGFYQELWRDAYQSGSVLYQSSTYGFLAEGHMLFGALSPIVSAIFINIIASKLYKEFFKSNSLEGLFIIAYLFTRMYFYTRSGYLDASNLWALIVFFVGAKLFFFVMKSYIRKKQ